MSKEFEIGLNLLKKVQPSLEDLLNTQDRLIARKIVNSIINPITASAYQLKVGEGPGRDELLPNVLQLVRLMRDMDDIESLKSVVKELLSTLRSVNGT
ncbi:MAG: hypothetical protein ABDH18_06140 [Aquificaceae bacterium]